MDYMGSRSTMDPFGLLPMELVLKIAEYFDFDDVAQIASVSKLWSEIVKSPNFWQALNPSCSRLTVIDGRMWQKYFDLEACGLSVRDEKILYKKDLFSVLKNISKLQMESNGGFILFVVPQGSSMRKLAQLAKNPKEGNPVNFSCDEVLETNRDVELGKTYTYLISNQLIKGTRGLFSTERMEILKKIKSSYPNIIEISALFIMSRIAFGAQFFNVQGKDTEVLSIDLTRKKYVVASWSRVSQRLNSDFSLSVSRSPLMDEMVTSAMGLMFCARV
jgi:hypothetical protein